MRQELPEAASTGIWYPYTVAATQWRNGLPEFGGIAGHHAVTVTADRAGPSATVVPGAATFVLVAPADDPRLIDRLVRVRVSLQAQGLPEGAQVRVNGLPVGEPLFGMSGQSADIAVFGVTAALREGENQLSLDCPQGSEGCVASFGLVETAQGAVVHSTELPVAVPADQFTAILANGGPALRRHGAWLVVRLADEGVPTMVRINDGAALTVQGGYRVSATGAPGVYRVPVDPLLLRRGESVAAFTVPACQGAACPMRANVDDVRLVVAFSDDEVLCLPEPERCADATDNDCDGLVDETSTNPCDDDDRDGCRSGRASCTLPAECADDQDASRVAQAPQDMVLPIVGIDALYADDSVVTLVNFPKAINLFRVLSNGATLPDVSAQLPPSGNTLLRELVLHVGPEGAAVPWGSGTRNVALREMPDDDGATLRLQFADGGTTVTQGQHLIVIGDNRPGWNSTDELFACPDGDVTYPTRILVRNACNFPDVDCSAVVGAGSPCDTSPLNDAPYGDNDGCRHGHLLPLGTESALVCAGDTAAPQMSPVVDMLLVSLVGATLLYEDRSELSVGVSFAEFNLRATLATGQAIPGLVAPEPPLAGAKLMGVRLHLASSDAARVPDESVSTGWRTVVPRAGEEDSGLEIDLVYPTGGVVIQAGAEIRARAVVETAPDWMATWTCWDDQHTVRRELPVTACDNAGICD